jgi:PAS domain S-box-containing protein
MSPELPALPPLVVVVNDDEGQRRPLCLLLQQHGLRVSAHATVKAAIQAMAVEPPALVVTDLCLPEIDGVRFCRMLRSSAYRNFNEIPILVASSTYAGADSESIMVELGANDFLRLPVEPEAFLRRVDGLLHQPQPAAGPGVLLISTESGEIAAVQAAFAANGFQVLCAASQAEAEGRLAAGGCDVAVLDLDLPGVDQAWLGSLSTRWPEAAFFTVTAESSPEVAVRSMRAGASGHLRRPFAPEYLCSLCEMARREKSLLRVQNLLERRTRELRRSEQELQAVVESTGQAFLLLEPDGRVELYNQAAARMAREVVGRNLRLGQTLVEMLGLEFALATLCNVKAAFAGEVVHHEVELRDHEGRAHWYAVTYAPVHAHDGVIKRVCFNAQDITERRRAEDALRESEARFRGMADTAPVLIWMTGPGPGCTFFNQGWLNFTGHTLEQEMGEGWEEGVHPDDRAACRQVRASAFAHRQPFTHEYRLRHRSGEYRWMTDTGVPRFAPGDVFLGYIGAGIDIQGRIEAESALRTNKRRLQALFDHSHDAILLADDEGRYVDANPAACQLLGYTQGELLALMVQQVFAASDVAWARGAWREFLAKGKATGEISLRRKDGSTVVVDYSAIAGILPGLHLTIMRDVTERRVLQAQLLRQQRLESVGRLASGVAHDLNNILTPILMVPAMLRPYLRETNALMLLDTVENGARRGSIIVRQLLSFARGMPGEKRRIDLRQVVRDSLVIIQETFPKNINVDWQFPPTEYPVLGDSTQLNQVIINLAINGSDAMDKGGRLVFSLDLVELTTEEARRTPDARSGSHVVLTVADHGRGIVPEHLDKIFDPFFTTKPFGQGSGLGLSTVLGIVRGHEGFVRVSSRVGAGTLLKVFLPLHAAPDPPAPAPPAAKPRLPSGLGRMVLVVDDEAAVREIVRMILVQEGYQVMCADGADAALSQIQAVGGRVDLVLTDMAMPGVSGAKLVERLGRSHPALPVLVMTGNDVELNLPPEIRRLTKGVLAKPFPAENLLQAVTRILPAQEVSPDPPDQQARPA